jgi:arabinan endo-1,5-alpha-L-arabinosidase
MRLRNTLCACSISLFFLAGCHRLMIWRTATLIEYDDVLDDFETGNLKNWTIIWGNLKKQPTMALRQGIRFGQQGQYFIGTTETGGTKITDFDDSLVGEIHSRPFTIKKNFISLLVGGGNNPDNVYVALVRKADGYVIKKETGSDSEEMVRKYWDVSDYIGEVCFIKIVDNAKGGWGHINVDDIRISETMQLSRYTPLVVAGEFTRIYNPSIGENKKWYINDHCFITAQDGTWHLFGITHEEPARPTDEDNFAHATAQNLTAFPWQKQPFALSVVENPWKERHLWAPHVVYHQGTYYMFYCAGGDDPTKYKIHLATSTDLWNWERHRENPVVVDGYHARDPFVMKIDDRWVMYYTATSDPSGGNHVVAYRMSTDLVHWGERHIAYTDPSMGKGGGPTESPFVVRRNGFYYLFIGPRGGYVATDVFVSTDPFHWRIEDKVGHIAAHAAEVVRDKDGKWYVSHCGWGKGGVYLAPLYWNDGVDNVDSSITIPK